MIGGLEGLCEVKVLPSEIGRVSFVHQTGNTLFLKDRCRRKAVSLRRTQETLFEHFFKYFIQNRSQTPKSYPLSPFSVNLACDCLSPVLWVLKSFFSNRADTGFTYTSGKRGVALIGIGNLSRNNVDTGVKCGALIKMAKTKISPLMSRNNIIC